MRIAFVGGTGPAGVGLAARFAKAGLGVAMGSRAMDRAEHARDEVLALVPGAEVRAGTKQSVLEGCEIAFLTVPADTVVTVAAEFAPALEGKIVVSLGNPIRVENGVVHHVPPSEGSIAEGVAVRAPGARVVSAFHEIHIRRFAKITRPIEADTLVCSDDEDAKAEVMDLARLIEGLRPVDAGPLEMSRHIEAFVAVLVTVNLRNKAGVSFRLTGL